ncbi:conjugal transfer protein TraW, partial [Klebsiella oxytoca]|uniref:conjugal transfer protein TraW n=2 Tax=Klebsiella/Raoultella group TaxID=2890311 RepID=UPI003A90C8F1
MKIRLSLLGVSLCLSASAHAYSVYVTGSAPVTTQIMPALGTIEATLADILATQIQLGTAVVNGNEQVASVVSEGFKTQREMDILARQTERLEDARKSFTVPESICSESASGAAAQVAGTSRATASSLRSARAAA